ncbi:hypothetical protein CAC42_2569 [Sphaceloma murrayae]|uniref:DUF4211 domain-containing protein n=1 Tax=Sphaceloma murrayae TaxID=2082308 RepID=A0A2K1QWF6_9PEZI|nr:hypothetical protein CAC42_2569 [Sphaceloma murrayae]
MVRSTRKRQARLAFTPLPSSSPASAPYHKQIRERAAAVGYEGSPSTAKRRKITDFTQHRGDPPTTADEDGDNVLPTPDNSSRPSELSAQVITLDSDSDASSPPIPSSRMRRNKGKQTTLDLASNGARPGPSSPLSTLGSSPVPTPDSGAFFRKQSRQLNSASRSSGRTTRSKAPAPENHSDNETRVAAVSNASDNFVELSGNDSGDDSDQLPTTPARRRRGSQRTTAIDSSEEDDEDDVPKSSRLRRGRRKHNTAAEDDEDSADLSDVTPRPSPPPPSSHVLSKEEQQELDDDVNDLKSSDSEHTGRFRGQPVQSERQLALERLKRRRAGIKEAEPEVQEISDDDEDSGEGYEVSEDEVQEVAPRSSVRDMFDADEDDKDFLADDGDDTMGAPDGLPLAFTRYASMKPKELFSYVVEWMVQKKLNPGFNMDDEMYNLAFNKLDDEVKALAGSKFESSAWKPDFLFALRARPEIAVGKMNRLDAGAALMGKCDACNRSGHPPSYEVQFQGRPYHVETLEDVDQHEDSDSEDGDDQIRDAKGHIILPEHHSFYVGKFCMANAETAHSLQHWRYHLYEWVVGKLTEMGQLTPEKIVQRDVWGEPKKRRLANKMLDQMVEQGTVRELYRDFRGEVEKARDAKQSRW